MYCSPNLCHGALRRQLPADCPDAECGRRPNTGYLLWVEHGKSQPVFGHVEQ